MTRQTDRRKVLKVIAGSESKPLVIQGSRMGCYVLEDATRVISRDGTFGIMGDATPDDRLGVLDMENLRPFVGRQLRKEAQPLYFATRENPDRILVGYRAEVLPGVCYLFVQSYRAGTLPVAQVTVAMYAQVLFRGLCLVGAVPLVDEVTGYQKVRPKDDLARRFSSLMQARSQVGD